MKRLTEPETNDSKGTEYLNIQIVRTYHNQIIQILANLKVNFALKSKQDKKSVINHAYT